MNTKKLIDAAKEIERIYNLQKERTRRWQKLAIDARSLDRNTVEKRRLELDSLEVIDYSNAIERLVEVLNEK